MKIITFMIAIIFLLFYVTIPAHADTTSVTNITPSTTTSSTTIISTSNDDGIVAAIYGQFSKSAALIGTALTVSSRNGIVTINGTVTQQSQADEAARVAKSVPGVKDVISSVNVITNPNLNQPVRTTNY